MAVSSLVRRARRNARLSQRALARQIGVGKSTVADAERDGGRVSLAALLAMLAAGGIELIAVDEDGEVLTMHPEELRDRAGRKLPAHLPAWIATDKDAVPDHWKGSARRNAPVRWRCSHPYAQDPYLPLYHPIVSDVPRVMEWAAYEREFDRECRRLRAADAAARRAASASQSRATASTRKAGTPPWSAQDDCRCSDECIGVGAACPRDCPCQCESAAA